MDTKEMLDRLKAQIRVDYDSEDEKLLDLLKSAEAFAVRITEHSSRELKDLHDGEDYPEPVKQAIIMLAGHWFENPTAMTSASQKENIFGFRALLAPYCLL